MKDIVDVWDETKILPGTNWMEKKSKELVVILTEVAVLLISANYLSSHAQSIHMNFLFF